MQTAAAAAAPMAQFQYACKLPQIVVSTGRDGQELEVLAAKPTNSSSTFCRETLSALSHTTAHTPRKTIDIDTVGKTGQYVCRLGNKFPTVISYCKDFTVYYYINDRSWRPSSDCIQLAESRDRKFMPVVSRTLMSRTLLILLLAAGCLSEEMSSGEYYTGTDVDFSSGSPDETDWAALQNRADSALAASQHAVQVALFTSQQAAIQMINATQSVISDIDWTALKAQADAALATSKDASRTALAVSAKIADAALNASMSGINAVGSFAQKQLSRIDWADVDRKREAALTAARQSALTMWTISVSATMHGLEVAGNISQQGSERVRNHFMQIDWAEIVQGLQDAGDAAREAATSAIKALQGDADGAKVLSHAQGFLASLGAAIDEFVHPERLVRRVAAASVQITTPLVFVAAASVVLFSTIAWSQRQCSIRGNVANRNAASWSML